ncbi:hypothetical protein Goarm_003609 [Gossypium armourianum]|nr:hypothetical protein [Gossypium armourianum]
MNCARIFSEKEEYLVKQWISDSLRVKLLNYSRIGVGFSNVGVIFGGCKKRPEIFTFCRALKEEKFAARRAILPVLQAEEDERFVKEWKKYLEYEAEVMKDVPGWKVGENVYNSGRWMPPATGELRPEVW